MNNQAPSPGEPQKERERQDLAPQALAQRLRSKDFSAESKVRESLRRQLIEQAAGSPSVRSGFRLAPARKAAAALNRLAWGGLFLAFVLTFAWNMGQAAPEPTRPTQLATTSFSIESAGAGGTVTIADEISVTHPPAAVATPGMTEPVGALQLELQPSLVPIPIPPSP